MDFYVAFIFVQVIRRVIVTEKGPPIFNKETLCSLEGFTQTYNVSLDMLFSCLP